MNYYYFFVLIQYHLGVRLCTSLESRDQLSDFDTNITNQSLKNQHCQRLITHTQMIALLSRNPCLSIEKPNEIQKNNDRTRRQIDGGSTDIKALQTTINDHRVMIEYLFNNSINETFLANTLHNHSRIAPSLSSWRDLVDIFCIGLVLIILMYLLACRAGFAVCDQLFVFLFRPIFNRLQKKDQQQQQQQHQHKQLHRQKTSTFSTPPPNTISENIKSLSMIADGVQPSSIFTKH